MLGMLNAKEKKAQKLLNRAVDWAGSVPYLAAEMRVSTQTIKEWIKGGRVPAGPARLLAELLANSQGFNAAGDIPAASLEMTLRA